MQPELIKKCPTCLSNRVVSYNNPEPHLFCTACFHRYKDSVLAKDYYNNLCGRSKMLEKSFERKNLERLKFLEVYLQKGMHLLELGCAEGALGEIVQSKYTVIYDGIEPSQDAKIAKTKLHRVWGAVREIPKNMNFDLILAFHVLEHIPNLRNTIAKLYKILSENGMMVLEVPNYYGNKHLPWDFNREHIHLFSLTSVSYLLEKHGFEIKEVSTGNYESAIYNDSMRIVVFKRNGSQERRDDLVKRFQEFLGKRYVIYGTGGDFQSLVSPYVKSGQVVAIMDSSQGKIGKRIIGKIIQGPKMVTKYLKEKFLIASYRYQDEILELLNQEGIDKSRIITLRAHW